MEQFAFGRSNNNLQIIVISTNLQLKRSFIEPVTLEPPSVLLCFSSRRVAQLVFPLKKLRDQTILVIIPSFRGESFVKSFGI